MKNEYKPREASTETNSLKKPRLSKNPSKASPLISSNNTRKNLQKSELNGDLSCYQDPPAKEQKLKRI